MRSGKDQPKYRIVLADDQREVRSSLRRFMEKDGRFDIVAEAENGAEAIACVETEHPEGLVLDLAMPGIDGLQALSRIREVAPSIAVVVLSSMVPFNGAGNQALKAGAVAVFDKYASPKKVIKALASALDETAVGAGKA